MPMVEISAQSSAIGLRNQSFESSYPVSTDSRIPIGLHANTIQFDTLMKQSLMGNFAWSGFHYSLRKDSTKGSKQSQRHQNYHDRLCWKDSLL